MAMPFDSEMLVRLGWRQGSILGPELTQLAREYAPARIVVDDADRFIVTRRLVAQWLAKRYIRAAFPTAFDLRWRAKLKDWQKLLQWNSEWLQGVYLRLDTLAELPERTPYRCHILLAVPAAKRERPGWPAKLHELQLEVQAFWDQFGPGIECIGVDPQGTDEITLADIERYQRFDSDWVSFEDDTSTTPEMVDMTL